MTGYTQEEYRIARDVNLVDYLRAAGYELEPSGVNDFQLKMHDSLKVKRDGTEWSWFSRGESGKSPIALVKLLEEKNTIEAIKSLASYAGGAPAEPQRIRQIRESPKRKPFQLPGRNDDDDRIKEYLIQRRSLDPEIIRDLIDRGLIYESAKYHNAVFVGQRDKEGVIRHASMRGTYQGKKPFKGDVSGSDKGYSFALEGDALSENLVVCESAIDVLSHASLSKQMDHNWNWDHRLALGGMSDSSLEHYLEQHPGIKNIRFCLDNDLDGRGSDGQYQNHGQIRAEKLMEKYREKGYQVSNLVPEEKDVNEILQKGSGRLLNMERTNDQAYVRMLIKRALVAGNNLSASLWQMFLDSQFGQKEIPADQVKQYPGFSEEQKESVPVVKLEGSKLDQKEADAKEDIMARLEQGIQDVYTSDNYLQYLKVMSKFHRYSVRNSILIRMQKPEATMVAGYQSWKKNFARTVKPGEKAIRILAPTTKNVPQIIHKIDPQTGEEKEERIMVQHISGFRTVPVFDVSQTDGKELPTLMSELEGAVKNFDYMMEAIRNVSKVPVSIEKTTGAQKGSFNLVEQRIVIKAGMSEAQTIKTAIHELTHSRMHSGKEDRDLAEVQAESAAFVVSDHFGLDTSEYSFPYVADWAKGKPPKDLEAALNDVRVEANQIISEIETELNRILEREHAVEEKKFEQEHVAIKSDTAREAFSTGIPIFSLEPDGKLNPIESKDQIDRVAVGKIRVFVKDIEKYREQSPKIYNKYLVSLFRKGFKKDPFETMKVFGAEGIKDTLLNQAVLLHDKQISTKLNFAANVGECMKTIQRQLASANQISGKVLVQINWSENKKFKDGQFFSLMAANKVFSKLEKQVRREKENIDNRGYDKTMFGLYLIGKDQCQYGMSRYDIGDGFAEDIIDFIRKTMEPDIVQKCEKEISTQEKKMSKKRESQKKTNEPEREEK